MISPEALEKARAIVDTVQKSITLADLEATRDCETFIRDKYVNAIAAALQAERDAAAPKLPDDLAGLVERLNGVYRVPITDGLGAVGSGEEPDNPNEFVQRFETPPIQKEAAAALQSLVARNAELEMGLEDLLSWFPDKPSEPEWRIKAGNYGADAAVSIARSLLNKDRQP